MAETLTERRKDYLRTMALSEREAAEVLGVAVNTVTNQRQWLYDYYKLERRCRVCAIVAAVLACDIVLEEVYERITQSRRHLWILGRPDRLGPGCWVDVLEPDGPR